MDLRNGRRRLRPQKREIELHEERIRYSPRSATMGSTFSARRAGR
jgi:hypothetical protein